MRDKRRTVAFENKDFLLKAFKPKSKRSNVIQRKGKSQGLVKKKENYQSNAVWSKLYCQSKGRFVERKMLLKFPVEDRLKTFQKQKKKKIAVADIWSELKGLVRLKFSKEGRKKRGTAPGSLKVEDAQVLVNRFAFYSGEEATVNRI